MHIKRYLRSGPFWSYQPEMARVEMGLFSQALARLLIDSGSKPQNWVFYDFADMAYELIKYKCWHLADTA